MDIRIDGPHEQALVKLMKRNGEKTSVGMTRLLIRDAARDAGLWAEGDTDKTSEQSSAEHLTAVAA